MERRAIALVRAQRVRDSASMVLAVLVAAAALGCEPEESGPMGGHGGSGATTDGGVSGSGGDAGAGGFAGSAGTGGAGGIGGSAGAGGVISGSVIELDPTFGVDGMAVLSVLNGSFSWDGASGIAVMPDDRIIVVGSAGESVFGPVHGYLAMRNEDGTPDAAFGSSGDGIILEDLHETTEFDSVALDGGGRILVGGWTKTFNSGDPGEFTLARYLGDGTRDATFGNDVTLPGVTHVTDPCSPRASDLSFQSDGRIVATGNGCEVAQRLSAVRVLTDGTPDPDFGNNGVLVMEPGYSDEVLVLNAGLGHPPIVVGGTVGEPGFTGTLDFALAGVSEDGSLEPAFGTDGWVVTDFGDGSPGRTEGLTALAAAPSGRILAGGWIQLEPNFFEPWLYSYDFLVAAYDETGALDGSFGDGGSVLLDFGSDSEGAIEVLVRANGNLLVVGSSLPFIWEKKIAIAHLNPDGTAVPGEHKALTELDGGGLEARGAVLDRHGRLLVASMLTYASGKSDVAITRYVIRPLD